MGVQLGDYVRFRPGMAPDALHERERDVGIVVALLPQPGPGALAVAIFDGYRSPPISPDVFEVVGEPMPAGGLSGAGAAEPGGAP